MMCARSLCNTDGCADEWVFGVRSYIYRECCLTAFFHVSSKLHSHHRLSHISYPRFPLPARCVRTLSVVNCSAFHDFSFDTLMNKSPGFGVLKISNDQKQFTWTSVLSPASVCIRATVAVSLSSTPPNQRCVSLLMFLRELFCQLLCFEHLWICPVQHISHSECLLLLLVSELQIESYVIYI